MAFVITQATIGKQVLEFIQEILGFGKVIPQSAITSRCVTQNKKEIDIIISLFNGDLVNKNHLDELKRREMIERTKMINKSNNINLKY